MLSCPSITLSPKGPRVSRIVAGMWRMCDWQMSIAERVRFIEQCLELGVSTFDHANIYGMGGVETQFGEALAQAPGLRQRIQLVTKCGIEFAGVDGSNARIKHYDLSAERIAACVEQSLRKFGVEQLEILLIHRPSPLMDYDEIAGAFERLHTAGKVAHFGVSNFSRVQFDALNRRYPLVTNQIELSPLQLAALDDGTLDRLQDLGVAPMLWSALGGGRLFKAETPRARTALTAFEAAGKVLGLSTAGAVYAWLLRLPCRAVPLTGSGRIEAVREAVAATKVEMDLQHWFELLAAVRGCDVP